MRSSLEPAIQPSNLSESEEGQSLNNKQKAFVSKKKTFNFLSVVFQNLKNVYLDLLLKK